MVTFEAQLDAEISHFRSLTYAESTKKSYSCHRRQYIQFCSEMGYRAVPVTQETLLRYTVFLARRLTVASVRKYLNVVRLLHLEHGFPNPLRENWFLDTLLKGVSREKGLSVKRKLPISPEILLKIKSLLNFNLILDSMFWAACTTAFFGFFRKSNLFPPSATKFDNTKHLCRSDFSLFHWGLLLNIRWSKTIQFKERTFQAPLPLLKYHPLCPVAAVVHAFALTPLANSEGPAFLKEGPRGLVPISPELFVKILRGLLTHLGLAAHEFSGHSFRRGSASWAIQQGIPGEIIKILGDWKSDAYLAYLSLDTKSKISSMSQFAENLPSST